MPDYAITEFHLDQGKGQSAELIYQPFATRTLKIQVSTTTNLPALRLRPCIRGDLANTGIVCGYADEGDAFLISWGGGHETGPCIKASDEGHVEGCVPLGPDDTSNIFFNVTHLGPDVPDSAALTLEAYIEGTDTVHASLTITLKKPASFPANDLMRFQPDGNGRWRVTGGHTLPNYDPRWWPNKELSYTAVDQVPLLEIRQDKTQLSVYWANQNLPIITITDQTRPSTLTGDPIYFTPGGLRLELFDWSDQFVALRVWFIWLNVRIPRDKVFQHEVPDAERFDFLIRKKNGKVALACTDLHWREKWVKPRKANTPVLADMGFTAGTLLMGINNEVRKNLVASDEFDYDLLLEFVRRSAKRFAKLDDEGREELLLDAGLQAHVPTLVNMDGSPQLTSQDVRYDKGI